MANTKTKFLAVMSVAFLTICMSSGLAQPGHWPATQVKRTLGEQNETAIAGGESVILVPAGSQVEGHRVLHLLVADTILANHLNSVVYFTKFMGGYPTGVNQYADLAKAQRFDNPQLLRMQLKYAWIAFFDKTIVGTPDNLQLRVWGVGPTGAPDEVLYSRAVNTSSFIARSDSAKWTGFAIQPAVTVSGPFFIGLEWTSAVDDTFGIFTEWNGEGDLADRAWEKWSSGAWYTMREFWPTFDRDLWVAATASVTASVELHQNYPNPFNPATTVEFRIQSSEFVTLRVYDLLGQEVAVLVNEVKEPGSYTVQFDARLPDGPRYNRGGQGSGLASGVYFYQLKAGTFVETKKLLLLR